MFKNLPKLLNVWHSIFGGDRHRVEHLCLESGKRMRILVGLEVFLVQHFEGSIGLYFPQVVEESDFAHAVQATKFVTFIFNLVEF